MNFFALKIKIWSFLRENSSMIFFLFLVKIEMRHFWWFLNKVKDLNHQFEMWVEDKSQNNVHSWNNSRESDQEEFYSICPIVSIITTITLIHHHSVWKLSKNVSSSFSKTLFKFCQKSTKLIWAHAFSSACFFEAHA